MRTFVLLTGLTVGGLWAAGCGSKSASSYCHDEYNAYCTRVFACVDASTQMDPNFIGKFGATESECEHKLGSDCATINDSMPCLDPNQKFHTSIAAACVDDVKAASCATITSGSFTSGNCSNVCS